MHWIAPFPNDTAKAAREKRVWSAAADPFRASSGLKSQADSAPALGLIPPRFAEIRGAAQRLRLPAEPNISNQFNHH